VSVLFEGAVIQASDREIRWRDSLALRAGITEIGAPRLCILGSGDLGLFGGMTPRFKSDVPIPEQFWPMTFPACVQVRSLSVAFSPVALPMPNPPDPPSITPALTR
jgi:hypothetical protein